MKLVPLGAIAEVIAGQSPEGIYYNSSGEGIPFYQGKKEFGERFLGEPTTWTTKITKEAQQGDILMSVRAPVGPINFSTQQICIGRGLAAIRSSEMIDKDFLFYFLLYKQPEISGNTGAVFDSINKDQIASIQVPLPSIEKQCEIVKKLDVAFFEIDLLEGNLFERESVIAEVTAEKRDQIFRKKTEGTNNSQQVALSEIARVINGRAYNQPELLKQGKYPVLRVGNFFSNRSWYYSDLELDKDKYCDNGDLLYAWSASFGPRIWDGGKVIYHYHIWKVEEKKEMVLRDWLYWWFLWDVNQIKEAHGTGSTMMHVTKGAMENRLVQLPSLEMQSQQVREIAELQLAAQKIESNYKDLAKKLFELRNAVLASAFEEEVA